MISLACAHCGIKLQVREELAGRSGPCPSCKQILTVPAPALPTIVPTGQINGAPSSLNQAGLDAGVTLDPPSGSFSSEEHRAVADLLAGRTRTGSRYVVEKEIARGGMGAVVRAVDCDIRREVAVKYMLRDGDTAQKARFVEEAQITGQLEHPNIVPIHELGVDAERRLFFAMKMVKGRSLAQVLDELRKEPVVAERTWSLGRLLNIFTNVCYALAYAHSRGVIHRDLKPANIMLGDFGETYVMDWGLAKVVEKREKKTEPDATPPTARSEFAVCTSPTVETAATKTIATDGSSSGSGSSARKVATSRELEGELTEDGAILGTPSYMSPEQARGDVHGLDHRSDVYSLGAILYEMLTLVTPVEKDGGSMAILMRVAEGRIAPPEQRTPARAKAGKIPKELAAVALKALALKPAARYQSVEALRRDIERFQEGRAVSAKHDTPWETAVKFVRRNKAFSAATAVGLVVLSSVLAVAFNVNYRARLKAEQNYAEYLREQEAKNDAVKRSIPALVEAARQLANDGRDDDARRQLDLAMTYDPHHGAAHLLRGQIRASQLNWAEARRDLEHYLAKQSDDAEARELHRLLDPERLQDASALIAAAQSLQAQRLPGGATRLLRESQNRLADLMPVITLYRKEVQRHWPTLGGQPQLLSDGRVTFDAVNHPEVTDLRPLRNMPIQTLKLDRLPQLTSLVGLEGMPLTTLTIMACPIADLGPLSGAPLERFEIKTSLITTLEPLRGAPLKLLRIYECSGISDLSPLRGMPLTELDISRTRVSSLEAIRDMPLARLNVAATLITDLSPLVGMPIESLHINHLGGLTDITPIRDLPLRFLDVQHSNAIHDLTPVANMPLEQIGFMTERVRTGVDVLRAMPTLKTINGLAPAEFWKRYDGGRLPKPK